MPTAWRLVPVKFQSNAFDGEGAYLHGGRWNGKRVRVVYTSATLSLAALELLVHVNPAIKLNCVRFKLEFDESIVERLPQTDYPDNWQTHPPGLVTQVIGNQWATELRTAVLAVPSALIPEELNYIINPLHPDFTKIQVSKAEEFSFDARLL